MRRRKAKIRIIYTNGAVQDIRCEEFQVTHIGGELRKVNWTNAKPRPLHIGINNIAAIYER